jgi:hypothetical protein
MAHNLVRAAGALAGAAHARRLEQVLVNLAVNSRDAMPDGGNPTIGTDRVDLDADESARLGLVPGDGLRHVPDVYARIFEPFFTTKDEGDRYFLDNVAGWMVGSTPSSSPGPKVLRRTVHQNAPPGLGLSTGGTSPASASRQPHQAAGPAGRDRIIDWP